MPSLLTTRFSNSSSSRPDSSRSSHLAAESEIAPRESLDPAREPLGRVGHGLDGVLRRPCHLHRDPPGVQVVKGPVDDELGRGAVPEGVEEGLGEHAEYPVQAVVPAGGVPASAPPARGTRGTPRESDDGAVPPEQPVEA
ncbi:hypothetical protein THAOC_33034, partial [Thalassiosira oceanica]